MDKPSPEELKGRAKADDAIDAVKDKLTDDDR